MHLFSYSISSDGDLFVAEGTEIKVASGATDTDFDVDTAPKSFSVNLTVSDGTYSDTAVLTINVVGVNDNSPAFKESNYSYAMNENTPAGTAILNVTATDADSADNDVKFSLSGENSEHFEIDEISGEIKIASPSMLNYTEVSAYTITVTAIDGGTPPRSSSVNASITIETSPELKRPASDEDQTPVREDKLAGEIVYTFVTVDKDTEANGLTYSIMQDPSTQVPFEIQGNTLKTKADIGPSDLDVDAETAVREYNITIRVSDEKYSDTGIVKIELVDVNDLSPVFAETSYTVEIPENTAVLATVATVVATDGDYTSPNNNVSHSIIAGDEEGIFTIDPASGEISLAKLLKEQLYKLTVEATDGGSPAKTANVTVTVIVDKDAVDECQSSPCANGATCRPNVNYYYCECAAGWTGSQCNINIDDCSPNPCENGGECQDGIAEYTCDCAQGWGGVNCTDACTGHTHGKNCAKLCSCNNNRIATDALAQRCNITTGDCFCNSHWTGSSCEHDAEECQQNTSLCTASNTFCKDTIGLYVCNCITGFKTDANDACTPDTSQNNPKILPDRVTNAAQANGNTQVYVLMVHELQYCPNLEDPDIYAETKLGIETQLLQQGIGDLLYVFNIACGSLTYDVFVEIKNTTKASIHLSKNLKSLKDSGTLMIQNQTAPVINMTVNDNYVTVENRLCVIYESVSSCESGYICQEQDGHPYCREVKDDNLSVILGVGLGVGVLGILLVAIVIIAILLSWKHRKSRGSRNRSKDSDFSRNHYAMNGYRLDDRNDRPSHRPHSKYDDRNGWPSQIPYSKYDDLKDSSYNKHGSRLYDNRSQAYKAPYRYSAKYY